MAVDLVPSNLWRFPIITSDLVDEIMDLSPMSGTINGLSVSEDDKNVYVEAAVPGVDPKNVDITFDKGVLWIKGANKEEEKNKKFYRKASNSFSYRVSVPGDVDWKTEPEATAKHGVMQIKFVKTPKAQPKKIAVKTAA